MRIRFLVMPLTMALALIGLTGCGGSLGGGGRTDSTRKVPLSSGPAASASGEKSADVVGSDGDGTDGQGDGGELGEGRDLVDDVGKAMGQESSGESDGGQDSESQGADDDDKGTGDAAGQSSGSAVYKWGIRFEDSGKTLGDADFDDAELCVFGGPLELSNNKFKARADGEIAVTAFSDSACKNVMEVIVKNPDGSVYPVTLQNRDDAKADPVMVPVTKGAEVTVQFKVVHGCDNIKGQTFTIGQDRVLVSANQCHLTTH